MNRPTQAAASATRCAIYTRKSTEEGLQQQFNSLDAQREAGEAYVASQAGEGWACLPDRYDDGGFTGGNIDRPGLQRLLGDIAAGKVDCVVVYKVDRLSRSLLDFARLMEVFEQRHVTFVSVTQQFSTASSMGRLMMNVLLSFAQFERETIAERTRDKIAATRRRGKWTGGQPLLGYDVDAQRTRLVVNAEEAAKVRAIFGLYLQHEALTPVVQALSRRGWVNKQWVTRAGHHRGGGPFTRSSLHRLLSNVAYSGKVRYKTEVHAGEHEAIVDEPTYRRVEALLRRNGATGGAQVRNRSGALLKGLIRCAACDCAMVPSFTTKGTRQYRYYTCGGAQRRGWNSCPSKAVPAGEIERFVVERLRGLGRDPDLVRDTLAQARKQDEAGRAELEAERRGLDRDRRRWHDEVRGLFADGRPAPDAGRLADLQDRLAGTERRLAEVAAALGAFDAATPDASEVTDALGRFDPVWQMLTPGEQAKVIGLLVERIDYDGGRGKVAVAFHPAGLRSVAEQFADRHQEARA